MKKIRLLLILSVTFLSTQNYCYAKTVEADKSNRFVATISYNSTSGKFTINGLDPGSGVENEASIQLFRLMPDANGDWTNSIYSSIGSEVPWSSIVPGNATSIEITQSVTQTSRWKARITYINGSEENTHYTTVTVGSSGGPGGPGGGTTRALSPLSETICQGSDASITAYLNGSIATNVQYWEKSTEPLWGTNGEPNDWTRILSTDNPVNDPDPVNANTKYRAYYSFGYSNEATVTINETTRAGTAQVSNGVDNFCSSQTASLHLTGTVVGTVKSWRYQYRTVGATSWGTENTNTTSSSNFNLNVSSGGGKREYKVWARVKSGVCDELSSTAEIITVYTKPTLAVTPGMTSFDLSGVTDISMSNPNNVSGTTFSWTANNVTNISGASSGTGSSIEQHLSNYTYKLGTVDYSIKANSGPSCSSSPQTVRISVNPQPTLSVDKSDICGNEVVRFTVDVDPSNAGTVYIHKSNSAITEGSVYFEMLEPGEKVFVDINVADQAIWQARVVYEDSYTVYSNTKEIIHHPAFFKGNMNITERSVCPGNSFELKILNHTGDIDKWQYSKPEDWTENLWHTYSEAGNSSSHFVQVPNTVDAVDTKYRVLTSSGICGDSGETAAATITLELPTESGRAQIDPSEQDKFCNLNNVTVKLVETVRGDILSWNHDYSDYSDDSGANWIGLTTETPVVPYDEFSFDITPNTNQTHVRRYRVWAIVKNGDCNEKSSSPEILYAYNTPVVDAGVAITLFDTDLPLQLTGESPTGGRWSGDHITYGGVFGVEISEDDLNKDHVVTYTTDEGYSECTASDNRTIRVMGIPKIVNSVDACLLPGETKTLTLENTYHSYQWYKDGELIGGDSELVIDEFGIYHVEVVTVSGFVNSSLPIAIAEPLAKPIQESSTMVENKGIVTISVIINSNPGTIYRWYTSAAGNDYLPYETKNFIVKYLNATTSFYIAARNSCGESERALVNVIVNTGGDDYLNWIHSTAYDDVDVEGNERIVSESKNFFDLSGKPLQSQTKSLTGDKILATQIITDSYDRKVLSTLPAPLLSSSFSYDPHFVTTGVNSEPYDYKHFDINNQTRYTPLPLNSDNLGTLGHYYSVNNIREDAPPVTAYPYTRTEYYEDGTGELKTVAGPGDLHRLGAGHNTISATLPLTVQAATALTSYIDLRQIIIPESNAVDMMNNGIMNVGIDANDIMGMSITDKNGNTIVSGVQAEAPSSSINFGNWLKEVEEEEENVSLVIDHVSYNFYDDAGRLVASIAPEGVKLLIDNGFSGNVVDIEFMTTYEYNHQGWLLAMTEPDAGRTEYLYRRDGSIRFSQNAEQRNNSTGLDEFYSYTSYDELGRPVESGEYERFRDNTSPIDYGASDLEEVADGSESVPKYDTESKHWVHTYYDHVDLDFGIAGTDYEQDFVMGAVSWMENENIKTWYSYDEMGRVKWMAQKPTGLPLSFVVSYDYDFLGNVQQVSYQSYDELGMKVDEFHHYYTYDKDKRLSQTFTSLNGDIPYVDLETHEDATLQAKYAYYLHGPLKRIELGGNLQGVDFVYNIQGWLTSINDPSDVTDQAGFSDDAFSMILEYYESNMTNMTPLGAVTPSPSNQHGLSSDNYLPQFAGLFMQFSPVINTGVFSDDNAQQNIQLSSYSAEQSQYKTLMENYALSLNNETITK